MKDGTGNSDSKSECLWGETPLHEVFPECFSEEDLRQMEEDEQQRSFAQSPCPMGH